MLPKSFFGQLLLGTVLVQILCLVLYVWFLVVSSRRGAEERTRERTMQQLDRLSAACSLELAHKDMQALHEVLQVARIAPTIDVARLTDFSGHTLAVSDNGRGRELDAEQLAVLPSALGQQVFKIRNGQIEAVTSVLVDGKPVALLWLEPNRAAVVNTADVIIRITTTYGGLALLANLLPIFLMVRSITRPLHTLREATNRVIHSPNLNADFPLPVTTTNEAGELTVSFNSMVKELEEQRHGLLETLALLNSMLSNAPIGFATFDEELRYVRVNEFLANMHGLPVEQHLGRKATDVYARSVGAAKMERIRWVFETGVAQRDVEFSGEMPHAPGVQRSWLMHFYPVRTEQDAIRWVGVIVVETTEQLKAEEALRKTEKLAATGRLAASIAHEINNPLESVTNLLYLLRLHDSLDATAIEYVSSAEAELARVSEITQQTLRFYRQSTSPALTNLVEVLDSILTLYQPRIMAARVRVEKDFDGEPTVFGFGGELRQVFANLIGNAIDAMPKGGKLFVRVRKGHGCQPDGAWSAGVRVTIADTGVGMSAATRQRIFEAFFTTKEATGTGLGLWVSEEIVSKHLGRLAVKSRQGASSGSCFMVFLPESKE